jgi:hypothetical protein
MIGSLLPTPAGIRDAFRALRSGGSVSTSTLNCKGCKCVLLGDDRVFCSIDCEDEYEQRLIARALGLGALGEERS